MTAPLPRLNEREMRRLEEIGRRPNQTCIDNLSPVTNGLLADNGLVEFIGENWTKVRLTSSGRALLAGLPEFEHLRERSPS